MRTPRALHSTSTLSTAVVLVLVVIRALILIWMVELKPLD